MIFLTHGAKITRRFTWHNKAFTQRTRLDRWYTKRGLEGHTDIRACPHSDHSMIEQALTSAQCSKRGKGTWKINQQVVEDQSFQRDIRAFQQFWRGKRVDFSPIQEWWNTAKRHYKEIAITHTVRRSRNKDRELRTLFNTLNTLQQKNQPDVQAINEVKQRISNMETSKIEGVKNTEQGSLAGRG